MAALTRMLGLTNAVRNELITKLVCESEARWCRTQGHMPEKPRTYQFYDNEKTIIYVGKAKNLKRRVSSYFHKEVDRFYRQLRT